MRVIPPRPGASLKRAAVLAHYEDVARKLGLKPQPLLEKVGLTSQMLSVPTQMIPKDSSVALLDLTAKASGCDTVGLMMAEARTLSDFGPVSLLLLQQPHVRGALSMIAQYRYLLNESVGLYVEDAGKTTLIREEITTDYAGNSSQSSDLAVGVLVLLFRAILGAQWRPQSVHFTHAASKDLDIHKRIFKCPLHFESDFNGVACLTADLDKPNPQADAAMAQFAQTFLDTLPRPDHHSLVQEVRRSVYLLLPMGRAQVGTVASGLGITERTLQRRLLELDTSFAAIVNQVRRELSQRYIYSKDYSLGRVAELLGYANLSAFTRWFTTQFRVAPSTMRDKGWDKRSV